MYFKPEGGGNTLFWQIRKARFWLRLLLVCSGLGVATGAGTAWCQDAPVDSAPKAPQRPAFLAPRKRAQSKDSTTPVVSPVVAPHSDAETLSAAPPQSAADISNKQMSFAEDDDPRDAKLRELEARLAATERKLSSPIKKKEPLKEEPVAEEEVDPFPESIFQTQAAPDDQFRTDTERMSDHEGRLSDLEARIKSNTTPSEKKESYPTHKITGFLQLDTAFYSQDRKNEALVGDAQDGTGFRRARLAILGKVAPKTLYQLEVDFATAGRPSFFDNYVEQEQLPILGAVRIGQYLQPFSVDAMSGFRNLPFLERSLPFLAFVPFRRVGAQAANNSEDEKTYWAYSVFRTGGFNNAPLGDSQFATDFGNVGGYSFSTRMTHLLIHEDGDCHLWHVGAAYDFSQLGANNALGSGTAGNAGSPAPFYQAKTAPEFGLLGYPQNTSSFGSAVNGTPNFVDTGKFQADNFNLIGLETVYQYGPFSFQSEWMFTNVNSVVGPVNYNGAYAEGMYRLTGEHRPYDKKLAALKNVIPNHDFISFDQDKFGDIGLGAWEVAGRVSYVDLRNPNKLDGHYYNTATNLFNGTSKTGNGTLTDTTAGLTWFLNAHTKWQFNWIHAFLNNTGKGFSQADLFVTRVQVDF
jgi:phosphate-selective porin OprO/OprP